MTASATVLMMIRCFIERWKHPKQVDWSAEQAIGKGLEKSLRCEPEQVLVILVARARGKGQELR